MKKIIVILIFAANILALASCNRDLCPAHSQNQPKPAPVKTA